MLILSEEHSSDSEQSNEDISHGRECQTLSRRNLRLVQPPGFKEILSRVGKFSGRKGDKDFSLWLTDYEEATDNLNWSDEIRVKWFSWFLAGPAKATWHTLTTEERGSWASIKIFQGQYGIHMDP